MAIHTKLLAFQKLGITLKKEGVNPHFGSSYVTLNEVLDKVKKPLNDVGILILQNPEKDGLRTTLLDTEDDTKIESFMPYVETSTAQKIGSNNTYLRRYALVTMLGLEDEDDDGNKASAPSKPSPIPHAMPSQTRQNAPGSVQMPKTNPAPNPLDPMSLVCFCGLEKKRIQTKKAGANQGRWFYACPKPMNQQCENSFQWEDAGDEPTNFEGDRETDYGPNGELLNN